MTVSVPVTDAELTERIAAGNREALADLYSGTQIGFMTSPTGWSATSD